MRLFAALIPPEHVLDEVEAAFTPYRGWAHLDWTRRETFHVTLTFYGEVADPAVLLTRLEDVAALHPRRVVRFAGAGAFPGPREARTLWAGVRADLQRLADLCLAAGHGAGAGRALPFRPHLTVARCRRPVDVRPMADALAAFEGTPWTAGEIHLVQSHPGPGTRYETLCRWPLRDATASR